MSLQFSPALLIEARNRAGVRRDDLARAIGRTYWTVQNWELGKKAPAAESLAALSVALGCSIDDLFEDVADSSSSALSTTRP